MQKNLEPRLTIMRAVHAKNGKPREAWLDVAWTQPYNSSEGHKSTQILVHSVGRVVDIAVLVRDAMSLLYRAGQPSRLIDEIESCNPVHISFEQLMRSRGVAERAVKAEMRRLLTED